jgi:5-(carboxyamino)imidazole ribonucleotide synthase
VLPDGGPPPHAEKARRLATFVAERLDLEGLLAVEMFLLADGRLVVNELVPCPHPTYLAADDACGTGQYEQLVRAVCGLPLGPTHLVRPVAVAPVYGDTWRAGAASRAHVALRVPGVALRLDDVTAPEPDQRLGYVAARGATPEEAVQRALSAHAHLAGDQEERDERDLVAGGPGASSRGASGGWTGNGPRCG